MASTIILRFSSIGITALVARILDAHDFGVFAVAATAFTLVSAIGEFGVTSCLARADLDVDALAPTLWTVSLGSSLLVAALLSLFAEPIATVLGASAGAGPIRVMAIIMALWGVSAVPTAQCVRDFRQNILFLANVLSFVPSTVVLLLLAKHGSGAMAFAWSRVAGQVVSCAVILCSAPKLHVPGLRRGALSILLRFGVPLAFANLASNVLQNVDYALIGHLIGPVALGLYVIAFNSASWSTSLLGTVLNTVAMPAFSRVKHDATQLAGAISDGMRAVMLISAPLCTLVVAVARPLILTVYGSKWAAAATVLSILAAYGIISIVCQLFSSMLAALGKSRSVLFVQLIWLAVLAPAMAIGVSKDGIVGAAIAHVVVVGPIVLPCYLIALTRATDIRIGTLVKAALPPFAAAVAAAVLAWLTAAQFHTPSLSLIAGLAVGVLFYLFVTAPQLIPLLGGGLARRPRVRRALRTYAKVGRTIGIPMGSAPRHALRGAARRRVEISLTREMTVESAKEAQGLIWISGQSWDQDGGTHRAMATAMSEHCRILWVDPPGSPATRNRRNRSLRPALAEVTDKITRLTPVVVPGFTRPGIRILTPLLVRRQIRWAVRKLGFNPNAVVMLCLGGLLGGWGSGVTNVMYGTDDYVAGAELMRVSAKHLAQRERQALAKADVVVAVSADLARKWTDLGASPVVIPNGCWPLSDGRNGRPAIEVDLPSPVVGLIGRLSDRIDFDVLEAIADAGQSLLLIGPRDPRWEPERFHKLTNRPSVRYIGPVPNAEISAHLAAVDVGITPYRDDAFNRASFPLKTLEYLSSGLPVVASGLPAMRWLRADLEEIQAGDLPDQILVLAEDSQDYVRAIRALALSSDEAVGHRIAFARRHSWASRAQQFATVTGLIQHLSENGGYRNDRSAEIQCTQRAAPGAYLHRNSRGILCRVTDVSRLV